MPAGLLRTVRLLAPMALLIATPGVLTAQKCAEGGTTLCLVRLDVSQGLTLGRGSPTPYTFAARLSPALGFGKGGVVRVGLSGAVIYANPSWEVAGGGRVSVRLLKLGLDKHAMFLVADAMWGTDGINPLAGALILDWGLVRFGGWVTYDTSREVTSIEFSVGTGLETLIPFLAAGTGPPDDDPTIPEEDDPDYD